MHCLPEVASLSGFQEHSRYNLLRNVLAGFIGSSSEKTTLTPFLMPSLRVGAYNTGNRIHGRFGDVSYLELRGSILLVAPMLEMIGIPRRRHSLIRCTL